MRAYCIIVILLLLTAQKETSAQTILPDGLPLTDTTSGSRSVMFSVSGYRPSSYIVGWSLDDPSDDINNYSRANARFTYTHENRFHYDTLHHHIQMSRMAQHSDPYTHCNSLESIEHATKESYNQYPHYSSSPVDGAAD